MTKESYLQYKVERLQEVNKKLYERIEMLEFQNASLKDALVKLLNASQKCENNE